MTRDDSRDAAVLFNQDGGTGSQSARHKVYIIIDINGGKTLFHHLADWSFQQIAVIENLRQQMTLSQRPDRLSVVEHRNLAQTQLVHLCQYRSNLVIRTDHN